MPDPSDLQLDLAIDRYVDEIVLGEPAGADPGDLDPRLAATVRRVQALNWAPKAESRFAARLWNDLMVTDGDASDHQRSPHSGPLTTSRWDALLPFPAARPLRVAGDRRRWALAQLATAALLVLTLAAGAFAIRQAQHAGREEPKWLPLAAATPAAEAPVAELLWELKGESNMPLDNPGALAIDPAGNVWVTDGNHDQYEIVSPAGELLEVWGKPGTVAGELNFRAPAISSAIGCLCGGLAFAPDGGFYVADTDNHRVQRFGPDRVFLSAWGSEGKDAGQFIAPGGIAIDKQGLVYVADSERNDIQVFDEDGNYLNTIGRFGLGDGQLYLLRGAFVHVDAQGNVWVSDVGSNRIQKFSPDGEFLAKIGGVGPGQGRFNGPGQIVTDTMGRLYVSDLTNRRVQVFAPDGTFLAALGDDGLGLDYNPAGLALDGAGNLYVSDVDGDRILKFRLLPPLAP